MSPSTGIKHYTYTNFNNNDIYNVRNIEGINSIIGGTGVFRLQEDPTTIYRHQAGHTSDQQHQTTKEYT